MIEEVKNSVAAQKCDHNHFLHPLCKNPSYSTGEKVATIALLILLNVVTAGIPLIIYSLYKAFSKKSLDGTKPTAVLERLPEIKSNQQQNSISLNTNQKAPDINGFERQRKSTSSINTISPPIPKQEDNISLLEKAKIFAAESANPSEVLAYIKNVLDNSSFQQNPQLFVINWRQERGNSEEWRIVEDSALEFFEQEFPLQQFPLDYNSSRVTSDISTSLNDNDNDDFIPCSAAAAQALSSQTTSKISDSSDDDDSPNNDTLYPKYSFSQSGNTSTYSIEFPSPPLYSYSSPTSFLQNQLNYCDEFFKNVASSLSVGNSQTLESSNPLETIQNQTQKYCTDLLKDLKGQPEYGAFTLTFNLDHQAFVMKGKMHKEPLSGLKNKIKRTHDSNKAFKKSVNTAFERSDDELLIEFFYSLSSGKTIHVTRKIKNLFRENSYISFSHLNSVDALF